MSDRLHSAKPLVIPALGKQIELGQFYDARTNAFYPGVSAWSAEEVRKSQIVRDCPHTNFSFSTNDTERNESAGLDVEGSVSLKLKLFNASGSAQYLNATKTHAYEARVSASCRVRTRERAMPSEQLANWKLDKNLETKKIYTHFVSKVTEGGEAHLSFTQKCTNAEEETRIKGQLSGSIKTLLASIEGSLEADEKKEMMKTHQSCEVKLTCDYSPTRPVVTFADAVDEASRLPERLCGATQTMTVDLLPIDVLDSRFERICRSLDEADMRKISVLLDDLQQAGLDLTNTKSNVVNRKWFPKVHDQIGGVEEQLLEVNSAFRDVCTRLLPNLRALDDSSESSQLKLSLRKAIKETEKAVKLVSRYVTAKEKAVLMVRRILDEAGDQFVNDLASEKPMAAHCLVLSLAEADTKRHPLKAKLRLCKKRIRTSCNTNAEDCLGSSSESDEDEDELEEWFESEMIRGNIFSNIGRMKELMMRNREGGVHEHMEYRIGRIAKVGKEAVQCGDVVAVDNKGFKSRAVFLGQPTKVIAKESKNDKNERRVILEWTSDPELSLGEKCRVTYWKISDQGIKTNEETSVDVPVDPSSCSVALPDLLLHCDSYYGLSVQILSELLGLSPCSSDVLLKPSALRMSVLSRLVQFSTRDNATPTELRKGGWEFDRDSNFLVVGHRKIRQRDDQEPDKDAVVMVDVMPEYEPEIPFSRDDKDATVVLMTGLSGHGKSTHINGMFNWIFGISPDDPIRLLLVDDRKHGDSSKPVTERITVYRIRPHSGSRLKAPLYLIDTPAFGEGIQSDENISQAYKTLFSRVKEISCVVLAMRASESQCGPKTKAALTNILHQFGKDMRDNIIALLTFANLDKAPALLAVLDEMQVPRCHHVEINNGFFVCHGEEITGSSPSRASEACKWDLYKMGNEKLFKEIGKLQPISVEQSAMVIQKRFHLKSSLLSLCSDIMKLENGMSDIISDVRWNRDSISKAFQSLHHDSELIIEEPFSMGFCHPRVCNCKACSLNSLALNVLPYMERHDCKPLREIALYNPNSICDYLDDLIAKTTSQGASSEVDLTVDATKLSASMLSVHGATRGDFIIRTLNIIRKVIEKVRESLKEANGLWSQYELPTKTASRLYSQVHRSLPQQYWKNKDVPPAESFSGFGIVRNTIRNREST